MRLGLWFLPVSAVLALHAAGPASAAAPPDSALTLVETEFHLLPTDARQAVLAHPYVVPGSLEATVDGRPWRPGTDFRVDVTRGLWLPQRPLGEAGGADALVRLVHTADLVARALGIGSGTAGRDIEGVLESAGQLAVSHAAFAEVCDHTEQRLPELETVYGA